jgi:hypothetical protein
MLATNFMTRNVFNFVLRFIEEKHFSTTKPNDRTFGFTRILFLPTEFFDIMSK